MLFNQETVTRQLSENLPLFKTKAGILLPGISPEARTILHAELTAIGISRLQIVEAGSYSFAMVVRYALGLTANGGRVCAIVGNSLASEIALATLRHLVNAGSEGVILHVVPEASLSPDLLLQLTPLRHMGVTIQECPSPSLPAFGEIISNCHNVLFGLFEGGRDSEFDDAVVEGLNELQTPIHTVEAPLGVDLTSGEKGVHPLFASSTLSLGAPLAGLSVGADCVGRHYLSDISCTRGIYEKVGGNLSPLFAEQPVLQILPLITEDAP